MTAVTASADVARYPSAMKPLLLALLAAVALMPADARTQTSPQNDVRVRIARANGPRLVGTLRAHSVDSLTITDPAGGLLAIPRRDITGMETSLGRHRSFLRNFSIGVGATAAAGGLLGALTWSECTETGFLACMMHPDSRMGAFGLGALVGGALGVPIGLIAGAAVKTERWAPMAVPGAAPERVSVRPLLGPRPGVVVSIAFGHSGHR